MSGSAHFTSLYRFLVRVLRLQSLWGLLESGMLPDLAHVWTESDTMMNENKEHEPQHIIKPRPRSQTCRKDPRKELPPPDSFMRWPKLVLSWWVLVVGKRQWAGKGWRGFVGCCRIH